MVMKGLSVWACSDIFWIFGLSYPEFAVMTVEETSHNKMHKQQSKLNTCSFSDIVSAPAEKYLNKHGPYGFNNTTK
jgi:uncharacterized protein YhbP (UPF0306 family)